jgi:hypothetical protein
LIANHCAFVRAVTGAALRAISFLGGKDKQVMAHLEGFR